MNKLVASDVGIIFSLLFFGIFFAYLSFITNAATCQDPTQQFNDTDTGIITGWYDYAKQVYNGLTFKGCYSMPSWFGIITISCIGTATYMILRLVRGGG